MSNNLDKDTTKVSDNQDISLKNKDKKVSEVSEQKPKNETDCFWYFDDKGNLRIDYKTKFHKFLEKQGFMNYRIAEKEFVLIQIKDNIISETTVKDIKDYVLHYIDQKPFEIPFEYLDKDKKVVKTEISRTTLRDAIIGNQKCFSSGNLEYLEEFTDSILEHTEDKAYFLYQNCFVEVSENEIKPKPYEELPCYVWEHSILDRKFQLLPQSALEYDLDKQNKPQGKEHHFMDFIWKISNENQIRFDALRTIIGYQLHDYFGYALKAVCLTDSKIEETNEANGRSGKSLIGVGISKMLNTPKYKSISVTIDGKTFDVNYNHRFNKCETHTKQIHINDLDMKKGKFDFELLYPTITEATEVNRKKGHFFEIKTKLLISSNQVILGSGESHKARLLEYELSDFFNAHNVVNDFYGDWFWAKKWTVTQWYHFDNFMLSCIQAFLANENKMLEVESINLEKRKFIQATCKEFVEFSESIDLNKQCFLQEEKERFESEYPDYENFKWFNQRKFTSWLRQFAELKKYKIVDKNEHNKRLKSNNKYYIYFVK